MNKKIAVLVGSLRKESYSKKIANEVISMASDLADFEIVPIADLPIYNQDFDDNNEAPESYDTFREAMKTFDAFLFVTPEYNRSVPAVMKNALDVGSRPYGESVWGGKPGAIISCSPGSLAAFGANHHLRQSLTFLDVYPMQQPELYLSNVANLLDDEGKLNDQDTREFLRKAMQQFIVWCDHFTKD